MPTVAVADEFFDAFARIPRAQQKKQSARQLVRDKRRDA
jgi:hypothetical protein